MDCQTALDILEVVHPNGDTTETPEVVAATEHVDSCADCESIVQTRHSFDDSVGQLIRDIPVPAGLEQRLLDNLAAHDRSKVSQAAAPAKPKRSRRRWLLGAVSAAACCVAGVWIWYGMQPVDSPQSLADVRRDFAAEFDQVELLPQFDRNFDVPLLGYEWRSGRVVVDVSSVNGYGEQADGQHLTAVYSFRLADGRRPAVRGALIVLREASVKAAPAHQHFSAGRIEYVGRRFATVSWSDSSRGLVYVCVLPVDGDGLNRLQRALRVEPA
jgi:hypothetical protein